MYKLPNKNSESYKGERGKVLVVGGSAKYYGAPILTALGAEKSGADLITLCLPEQHLRVAKNYSLNFFLHSYVQGDLGLKDIGLITALSRSHHAMVIGNGIGSNPDTKKALLMVLQEIRIPIVIDAEALIPEILKITPQSQWVLTPHVKEFERLFGIKVNQDIIQITHEEAKKYNLTIVLKGMVDYIADDKLIVSNHTGCPQMRVGGTGDSLAGIIASYIAQGLDVYDSAKSACYYFGRAGEMLAKEQVDFSSYDLIKSYPALLKQIIMKEKS